MKPEIAIIKDFAKEIAERIARKTISQLQSIHDTLSGEDSGLVTAWDEICVQFQSEFSFFWDLYDETARGFVSAFVQELPSHEKAALWFQTDAGWDYLFDEDDDNPVEPPVIEEEVVQYVLSEYVYFKAGRWSNKRIRNYIYGSK